MFKTKKFIVFFVAALMGIAFCQAAEKSKDSKDNGTCGCSKMAWIGLGFFSPVQYPCEESKINGFRFSALYTYNKAVNGFDCGLLCDSGSGGTNGIQTAISNRTSGIMNGFSLAFVNIAETEMHGIQLAACRTFLGFYLN